MKQKKSNVYDKETRIAYLAELCTALCVFTVLAVFVDLMHTAYGGTYYPRLLDQTCMVPIIRMVTGLSLFWAVCLGSRRRSSRGVVIALLVLLANHISFSVTKKWMESKANATPGDVPQRLVFGLVTPDDPDAELWVNGVYLGRLPVETTYGEFFAKVPLWNEHSGQNETVSVRHYTETGSSGKTYNKWSRFHLPEVVSHQYRMLLSREQVILHSRDRLKRSESSEEWFFAQVRIGQEWAYGDNGYGGGSGSADFYFTCFDRQNRVEQLLDRARLHHYQVSSDWFEAMETCRIDAWVALRRAMDKEPQFAAIWDAWAVWKYGLDTVIDAQDAWQLFMRIVREAEKSQYYLTASVAGRAVELIAAQLRPADLIRAAMQCVRPPKHALRSFWWEMNSRVQFGTTNHAYGPSVGEDASVYDAWIGVTPRHVVIGHALWGLDALYQSGQITGPNLVRTKVIPAALIWNCTNGDVLKLLGYFNTPEMDRFLQRQKWDVPGDELTHAQRLYMSGAGTQDGWLYLLASLPNELGRKTRQTEADRILDMCNDDIFRFGSMRELKEHTLLFLDPVEDGSLAALYWPRFRSRLTERARSDALDNLFVYLAKMEPYATVDMYVQAWRDSMTDRFPSHFPNEGLRSLVESDVDPQKRKQIHDALREEFERDPSRIMGYHSGRHADFLNRLQRAIQPWTEQERAREILADLQAGRGRFKPEHIALWLEHTRPDHDLVALLAASDRADLRKLALPALRAHPSPQNQALLQVLLQDSDREVKEAARAVKEDLNRLANRPLHELLTPSEAKTEEGN